MSTISFLVFVALLLVESLWVYRARAEIRQIRDELYEAFPEVEDGPASEDAPPAGG